jgi:hypothetical protein
MSMSRTIFNFTFEKDKIYTMMMIPEKINYWPFYFSVEFNLQLDDTFIFGYENIKLNLDINQEKKIIFLHENSPIKCVNDPKTGKFFAINIAKDEIIFEIKAEMHFNISKIGIKVFFICFYFYFNFFFR